MINDGEDWVKRLIMISHPVLDPFGIVVLLPDIGGKR
jgi:hypothetical protein